MKKLIVGIFTFALLFTGVQNVFAANPFNGTSGDCNPGVGIGVYPNNIPRDSYGCWTATSISANPGDTINVAMYYRNNTGSPLTNVRGSIVKSSAGPSNTFTFTGIMYSDQGSQTIGTVTLTLNSSQTLTYSSTHFMKNAAAVKSDTDTSVFHNDGGQMTVGSVPAGWNDYGEFLAVYKVNNTTPQPQLCTDQNALNYGELLPCKPKPVNNCTISNFSANPTSINTGGSSNLSWNTTNCTSATISTIGSVNTSGAQSVSPSNTTTYTLNASGSNGSTDSRNVTVTVNQPVEICSINSFSANPTSIIAGDSSVLNWNTTNCTSATISSVGNVNTNGSKTVWPTSTLTFTLTAYGTTGAAQTRNVTVAVGQPSVCSINSFSADNTSIISGNTAKLNWNTENCTSVSISGVSGSLSRSGTYPVNPTYTTSYVLNAYGNNGSDSDSVTIYVNDNNNCNNGYYNSNCNNSVPTVSTYVPTNITDSSATLSGYANGNGSLINSWTELPCYGAKYGMVYNQSSSSLSTPVYSLLPNTTYNYCMVAQSVNNNQLYRGSSVSFITTGQGYIQPPVVYTNKSVVTTVATNITKTSAQLNGYITNSNYYNSSNTYFEYGSTVNLGSRTNGKSTIGNSNMSDLLTGLNPNTIYFFRAVSEGSDGVAKGSIEIFKTLANTVTTPIYIQGTTIIGTASPILLNISNKYEIIGAGDTIDYIVTYKNIGKSRLTSPMVQVMLPTNVTLINSSRGTYAVDTHTLSAPISDLNPGDEGAIYLQARVDSIPLNNSQIATTALLIYKNPNGSQENAMAYVINVPKAMAINTTVTGSVLGGAVLFGGLLSIGLIGWLLIILLILLLILIIRTTYGRRPIETIVVHTPTH